MEHTNTVLLRWLPFGAVISVIAFLLGSVLLITSVRQNGREQHQICRVAERDNQTLRSLLLLSRENARTRLQAYPDRLAVSELYYKAALALLKPVDCKNL